MAQLVEKRKKEANDKAKAESEATQQAGKQTSGTERGYDKGMRSPSPETQEETEQHGVDSQEMSTHIKRPKELEKGGSRKKSKVTKTSLDPITLIEGDLHDFGDIVRDATADALQQFEKQQKIILGTIQIGLQELQTCTSQLVWCLPYSLNLLLPSQFWDNHQ